MSTVKVSAIPSFVLPDDFRRLFSVEGCLEARLMGRQAEGDQLGYVEFQDAASASSCVQQFQGYLGLGGRGLRLETVQLTLGQLTGTPAAGTGNKRQRDDGSDAAAMQQPQKQARSSQPGQSQADVASLLQSIDPTVLRGLLQSSYVAAGGDGGGPPPPPLPPQQQQAVSPRAGSKPPPMQSNYQLQQQYGGAAVSGAPGGGSSTNVYQPEFVQGPPPPQQAPPPPRHGYGAADAAAAGYQPRPGAGDPYRPYPPQPMQSTYQQGPPPAPTAGSAPPPYGAPYAPPPAAAQPPYQAPYQPPPQHHQQYQPPPYGGPPPSAPPPHTYGGPPPPHGGQDPCATLYTEGFPPDTSKREMAHIFRHFPGFMGLRIVIKDSKKYAGEKLCMAFVEFDGPGPASEAMDRLQGYVFDLDDPESVRLHLKYARPMENPRAALAAAARHSARDRDGGKGRGPPHHSHSHDDRRRDRSPPPRGNYRHGSRY